MDLFGIKIIFAANSRTSYDTIKKYFNNVIDVSVYQGDISQIKSADCVVIPGNSYGTLKNNVTTSINMMFNTESYIKTAIESMYCGEQPNGTCIILDVEHPNHTHVAYVPIMRVESDINKTYNVYHAFRALLVAIINHNKYNTIKIKSISCTPFGIENNNIDVDESVRQMRVAYSIVMMKMPCNEKNTKIITECLV
uniref:Macro domain containing protein n=1 Tax=Mimivirus LCMiAC01 TaxID=2506608 RepID=A0A481Z003_9VIRU|nr:MAG: macro domain containing protein [Mimivirus LCMiAC01]